ncbi:hypothetical protein LPJ60_006270, partial [Coemansia sp. RSA 2675]
LPRRPSLPRLLLLAMLHQLPRMPRLPPSRPLLRMKPHPLLLRKQPPRVPMSRSLGQRPWLRPLSPSHPTPALALAKAARQRRSSTAAASWASSSGSFL